MKKESSAIKLLAFVMSRTVSFAFKIFFSICTKIPKNLRKHFERVLLLCIFFFPANLVSARLPQSVCQHPLSELLFSRSGELRRGGQLQHLN